MAKIDGLFAFQRIIKAYEMHPSFSHGRLAKLAKCSSSTVSSTLTDYHAGHFKMVEVNGEIQWDQIERTGSEYDSHNAEKRRAIAEEKRAQQKASELEQYFDGLDDDPEERNMQWYAAGALTGIIGTLVVLWLAGQIAG